MPTPDYPHPFKEMYNQQVRLFKRLPLRISQWALLEIKENFRRGGYVNASGGTVSWKKRGETWKKDKSNSRRALLILTGRMRRSLKASPLYNEARVVTDVDYAEAHQNGFKGTVTQRVKAFSRRGKKGKIQVKAHTRHIKLSIPARPFMEVGGPAFATWENKILTELDQLFLKT